MRDFRDAKAMAHALRDALKIRAVETTHSESLELIAKAFGYDNWNILSAKIEAARPHVIDPEASAAGAQESASLKTLYCSFCGKSQHDVQTLIAGPSVYICDKCAELCVDLIHKGILWKVFSFLRSREETGSDDLKPLLDHVRTKSTEEVASYVEHVKVAALDGRRTLQFIDRRLETRDGEVPQQNDAQATRLFADLKTKTKEQLLELRETARREMVHYEDALRIGTTVLEERRSESRSQS
jgi:hypothetical protein